MRKLVKPRSDKNEKILRLYNAENSCNVGGIGQCTC